MGLYEILTFLCLSPFLLLLRFSRKVVSMSENLFHFKVLSNSYLILLRFLEAIYFSHISTEKLVLTLFNSFYRVSRISLAWLFLVAGASRSILFSITKTSFLLPRARTYSFRSLILFFRFFVLTSKSLLSSLREIYLFMSCSFSAQRLWYVSIKTLDNETSFILK